MCGCEIALPDGPCYQARKTTRPRRCMETVMNLSRRDLLALSGVALAGTTLRPSAARAQSPKRGGTMTIRGWDPPLFDPMLQTAYRVQIPNTFTHSRLVKHKAGAAVTPATFAIEGDLAESWSQPNETTYVFKLRRGVRWHPKPPVNGRELTAEDVRYSIERFLTVKGNPMAYMLGAVDRVEAVDRYTVKLVLKEPFSWLLDVLANPMSVAIVARECVEKFGDLRRAESVVGTGPWMLDSYRPNVGITFVRNPQYFVPGLPYIDRIEYLVDEDNASRMAAFLAASTTWAGSFREASIGPTGCRSRTRSSTSDPISGRRSFRATWRRTSPCVPISPRSRTSGCGKPSRSRSTGRE